MGINDMGNQKQSDFMSAIDKIADIIKNQDDHDDILENANQILGETLGLDRTLIYYINFDENYIQGLCEWLKDSHPDINATKDKYSLDLFKIPFTQIKKTQNYLTSHANSINEHFIGDGSGEMLHGHFKIQSLIWYPFDFDGNNFYVFTLNQILYERDWTEDELNFVGSVARQVSLALMKLKLTIERQRLKEQEAILKVSEERFRELVDTVNSGIAIYEVINDGKSGSDYIIRDFNQFALMHEKMNKEDVVGKSLKDIRPNIDEYGLIDTFREVWKTGESKFFPAKVYVDDKYFNYYENRVFRLPSGEIVAVYDDVTTRETARLELKKSEERYDLTMQAINDGIWDWDIASNTIYFDERYYTLAGYKPFEFPAAFEEWQKRVHPDDIDFALKEIDRHVKKESKVFDISFRFLKKDENWMWMRGRGKIVEHDKDGNPLRMVGTHTDITEKKQLENRLQQSQKMESIGQLAGGIAHDFNNILYPIIGFTQMSMDELPESHPVRENLQDVMDGAKRARDLVKRILLFSRQKDKKLVPLPIKPVVEESLKLLRSSIPVSIDIQSKLYDGEDFILCDETEIHEIVINLCTNAYHSMDEKGDTIKIDLDKKDPPPELKLPEDEYLCLSVSDNGSGIEPGHLQNIFEPYFTTKEVGKGSGLGLSVVHGIVKSYQGEIAVESILGKGTVFNIFLPVTDKTNIPDQEKEPLSLLMGDEKILFVDDEKAIVKLGTRVLEKAGFKVTGAVESSKALALFKKNPEGYDLIITDMTMPGMVGTELAEKIFEIKPDIPVLICSGYSEKLDKSKIERPNIKGYLDKPILADKLIVRVREILDQKQGLN